MQWFWAKKNNFEDKNEVRNKPKFQSAVSPRWNKINNKDYYTLCNQHYGNDIKEINTYSNKSIKLNNKPKRVQFNESD